jgi:ATP-binding cassette subfamily C exporter for protease/lipase
MSPWSLWRRHLLALRPDFWQAVLISMLINTLMVLPSLYMLQVYDRVMVSQNGLTLVALTLVLTLGLLAAAWLEQGRTAVLVRMGQRMDGLLASRVHEAALQRELHQPSSSPQQALLDLNALRQFVTGQGLFVLFDLPWFPIYLAIMFLLHPLLGWIGLAFSGVLVLIALASHRSSRAVVEGATQAARQAQQDQLAQLRNAEAIHAMGMLGALRQRWQQRHHSYGAAQQASESLTARYSSISKQARHVQQALSLGAGAWLVLEGQISPGAMIAANILMTKALQPLDLLVSSWSALLSARIAVQRLSEVLEQAPADHAQEIRTPAAASVSWQGATVCAPASGQTILHDINLQLPAGRLIGLVGPSGSGKSTLARVMLGLWPRQACQGRIEIDGLSVFDWDRQSLGPALGYLPQEPALLEGTLAQNIARFGRADPQAVVEAAQRVGIHELILALPQGYDTPAGEAGQLLSGGQRQLIALAQAMYGSPRLVVLDEPNSNLDEHGERCLVQALKSLREQGSSVLLITHRPEILQALDACWQLDGGRLSQPDADRAAAAV